MANGPNLAELPEIRQVSHYVVSDAPLIVMRKAFPERTRTGSHSHDRGQLLFAIEGLLVANTAAGTWFVPRGHALWMPPGFDHDVAMQSAVTMCAAYVQSAEAARIGKECRVLRVSTLLEALLEELLEEPADTERAAHLGWIVLDEIRRIPATPFVIPLPKDPRLMRLARLLIEDPGSPGTIDWWCDAVGLSRRTLTRQFRSQTGLSFGDWRRRLRLVSAMTRLSSDEPFARVAAALGYRDHAAFRAMASRYGAADLLTPKAGGSRWADRKLET